MRSEVSSTPSIEDPEIAKSVIFDAFCFAALLFGVGLGAVGIRFAFDLAFASRGDHRYLGSVVFNAIVALTWFLSCFFFLSRFRSKTFQRQQESDRNLWSAAVHTIASAICISAVLSICLWGAVSLSDEIFESRLLPWISPLITFQSYGIGKASGLFPCRMEDSDLGCEAYKFIPTMLGANVLMYFPFILSGAFAYRRSNRIRGLMVPGANLAVRVMPMSVAVGLVALLLMHDLGLDTHHSLYPGEGFGHWHFGLWELVDDATGTLIVIAGMLFPFYSYRACRCSDSREGTKNRTLDLTVLVMALLLALMLGNIY